MKVIKHHGRMFPSPRFFPDAKMNFAQSVLSNSDPTKIALIESSEGSLQVNKITWAMLYSKVKIRADALISLGVSDGDRVAAVVANTEHSITLCLATLSIGAIWSSISPDFGTKGILDRLLQIQPKVVFADPSTRYNGKLFDLRPTIEAWGEVIVKNDPQVHIILTPTDQSGFDISAIPQTIDHDTFISKAKGRPLEFSQFSFDKPAFIFYSSGTTGSPKCILHSAGGVLMQVRKDYELQIGVLPTDILFQYTTTAWIMWAFILSALGTGCSIVLYTGSPVYPNVNFIPKLLSELKVTVFGTSAKYLTDLMDSGSRPRDEVDLSSLRKVSSTGSVLPPDVAVWFYAQGFPRSVQLVSGSGGTDCACACESYTKRSRQERTNRAFQLFVVRPYFLCTPTRFKQRHSEWPWTSLTLRASPSRTANLENLFARHHSRVNQSLSGARTEQRHTENRTLKSLGIMCGCKEI